MHVPMKLRCYYAYSRRKRFYISSCMVENIFNRLTGKKKYLLLKNTQHLVMTNNVDEVVPPITAWLKRSHVNSPDVVIFKNIRSGVSLNKLIS